MRDPQTVTFYTFTKQCGCPGLVHTTSFLPFVRQACVPVCFQLFPLFLLFFSVSKPVLKQLILKEQTLSFQFPLQSNLQSFWFHIQPAPWQLLQDSGMAQKSGTFLQAETLSKPCKPTGQECKSLLRSISWQLSQSVPRLRLASDLPAPHTTV